jgi:component of DNA polymerase V
MSTIKMTNHGGSRKGAGRKSKSGEKTVVKRIPASLVGDVNNLIDQARTETRVPIDAMFPAKNPIELLIPLALEKIPAGFPSPAEPYIAEYIDFNKYLISNPAATFFARSGGQSMLDAGIDKDDILVIDRSVTPKHRDIVMADLGNEFTIKRLYKFPDGRIELHSENSSGDYPNFSPKEGDTWAIVGVLRFIIKDYR